MWFKSIKIPDNGIIDKITTVIAPHVFAAYLIHEQGLLRIYLQHDLCRELVGYMPNDIYLYLYCIAILLLSVIIDKGRALLFNLSKIDYLIKIQSERINRLYKNF